MPRNTTSSLAPSDQDDPGDHSQQQPQRSKSTTFVWKRVAFVIVALGIGLLLLEGLANVIWTAVDFGRLEEEAEPVVTLKEDSHCQYDEELGWVNIPDKHIPDFYAPGADITINERGLRITGGDQVVPQNDAYRLVCLGDSFTLGYGVGDDQTYPAQLRQLQPGLETFNLGQGGYSIGQSYLWYKRLADELNADAVVLTLILADFHRLEIERTVNGYATPTFALDSGGGLVVSNIPVPPKLEVGRGIVERQQQWEFLARRSGLMRTASMLVGDLLSATADDLEAFHIGIEIISQLKRLCDERGTSFAFVLMPTLQEYEDPALLTVYRASAESFRPIFADRSVPFRDLSPAFDAADHRQALYLEEQYHHFSPRGNALVATELSRWLSTVFDDYPAESSVDPSADK